MQKRVKYTENNGFMDEKTKWELEWKYKNKVKNKVIYLTNVEKGPILSKVTKTFMEG